MKVGERKGSMRKLSFVIPCYRSADSISQVVHEIIKTVEADARFDYEIICINDCSPDNTYQVLQQLSQESLKIKIIDLSRNFGQHSALMAGFNHVTGDIIVCLDDDGQNPPSEMFKLIDKLDEGYDLVSAKVFEKKALVIQKDWYQNKFCNVFLSCRKTERY